MPPSSLSAAEIEAWLITQLAQRLGVPIEEIDAQQSVLRYGVDSLVAIEMVADLEDWLACNLPLTLLWDYPTLAASAAYIADVLCADEATSQPLIETGPQATGDATGTFDAPLSSGQQALWLLQQRDPTNTAYNLACAVRIPGPLDVPVLHEALQHLVTRHAALRTTFPTILGQPCNAYIPRCLWTSRCRMQKPRTPRVYRHTSPRQPTIPSYWHTIPPAVSVSGAALLMNMCCSWCCTTLSPIFGLLKSSYTNWDCSMPPRRQP